MATSWRSFNARVTAVFAGTTGFGICLTLGVIFLLGRFRLPEFQMAVPTVLVFVALSGGIQFFFNRRWLRHTRAWYRGNGVGDPVAELNVYDELLRYPWRGSGLAFFQWEMAAIIFVVIRAFVIPDAPWYRDGMILSAGTGAVFLNWTSQYFLLRRNVFRTIESLAVDRTAAMAIRRRTISRKYLYAFGSLLVGMTLLSATIAYGLNRNLILETEFRAARDRLMASELMIYQYVGDTFDFQDRVAGLNEMIPGVVSVTVKPSETAVELERIFARPQLWLGMFPYYDVEIQKIPETFTLYRPLVLSNNRRQSTYLEYELGTESILARLNVTFWKIAGIGILMVLIMLSTTGLSMNDVSRPIRLIRRGLHPTGDAFVPPPMIISDDELMAFSMSVRGMFLRLRRLFEGLLAAYWDVKDERARLQEIALRFQQRTQRDSQQIHLVADRLRELTDRVQDLGGQLEAMSKVSDQIGQAVRMMVDTAASMQNENSSMRTRIRDSREWVSLSTEDMSSVNRAMEGLESWVAEASQDFDIIQRRFQELVTGLEPVDQQLVDFDNSVQAGTEHTHTIFHLLSGETDRYTEGIELIEQTQNRLDEVMLQFQEVESIREQIDMLSFQAAVVASQSSQYERQFRYVSDEIRDLSERAAAGIQQIFTAIWILDQQGKTTLQRILNSRFALTESLESSRRAHGEADKGRDLAASFARDMYTVVDVIREESDRTDNLVDSLRQPFTLGTRLVEQVEEISEVFRTVSSQTGKMDEVGRRMDLQIQEQFEGLRVAGSSIERISMNIRELMSSAEGMIMQSRTLRSILERLVTESAETSSRIEQTLVDLQKIEEEVFRNEAEVKRISAELQAT